MRPLEAAQGSKRQASIPTRRSRLGFAGKANVLGFRTLVPQADAGASHAARDPRHGMLSRRAQGPPLMNGSSALYSSSGSEESADVRTQRRPGEPDRLVMVTTGRCKGLRLTILVFRFVRLMKLELRFRLICSKRFVPRSRDPLRRMAFARTPTRRPSRRARASFLRRHVAPS